jgi:CO/xanthine dehydrogenase Mo-binding subunit
VSCLGNGGAFGGKADRAVEEAARRLADAHGRAVLALYSREDVIRLGPKRPPVAGGVRADGSGLLRLAGTEGAVELMSSYAPAFDVQQITVAGPPTSLDLRAAVWAEVAILGAVLQPTNEPIVVVGRSGSSAAVSGGPEGIEVSVRAGQVLDPVVLRSYCIGAAHAGWSWATSEALTVTADGEVHDLTVRSLGILGAADTPPIRIELVDEPGHAPVNGSDAVFAAAAALAWRSHEFASRFPLRASARDG